MKDYQAAMNDEDMGAVVGGMMMYPDEGFKSNALKKNDGLMKSLAVDSITDENLAMFGTTRAQFYAMSAEQQAIILMKMEQFLGVNGIDNQLTGTMGHPMKAEL